MSAKNIKSKSRPYDTYPTPPSLITTAIQHLQAAEPTFAPPTFLEPGCGGAPFCDAARVGFPSVQDTTGIDLLGQQVAPPHTFVQGDFLSWQPVRLFGLIATNPPFTYAEAFMRRSVKLLEPGGLCLFLLRLAFLSGVKRGRLWADVNLRRVMVLRRRPSFTGDGKSDSADYAWFIFDGDKGSGDPVLEWI